MYDDFKVANYPLALLSPELYARPLSRLFSGDVMDGLTVTPGTGMQVVLAPGNAMVRYGSTNVESARLVSLVDDFNLTITTADGSNPRIDVVALYVDNGETLPGGAPTVANLDGLGVSKAIVVAGTPAASPTAPDSTAIQSAVGGANPYIVLAQVRVDAGVSVIASNKITDYRTLTKVRFENGMWWEELGRTTLTVAGDTIAVTGLAERRYLKVLVQCRDTGGTINGFLQFNGDAGNNYVRRFSVNGGDDTADTSQSAILVHGGTTAAPFQSEITIYNVDNDEKSVVFSASNAGTAGAANAPNRIDGVGKWANTADAIASVTVSNQGAGDYAIGSTVVVLGHD